MQFLKSIIKNQINIIDEVSFDVYTEEGIKIPKENYKNAKYDIAFPINEKIVNLTVSEAFAEKVIDVYDAKEPFFNDICYPYSTENDTDVILKDRRNDIFQNVTFCPEGGIYKGINHTTKQVNCEFDPSTDSVSFNDFTKDIFSSNINIVRCLSTLTSVKPNNIGMLSCFVFLSVLIAGNSIFLVKDFILLKQRLFHRLINSPPLQEIKEINEKEDFYTMHSTETKFVSENQKANGKSSEIQKKLIIFPITTKFNSIIEIFFLIFLSLYLDKENISMICFPRTEFDLLSININYVMFGYCLDFVINALFYTDDQLSSRYQNGTLTFAQDLLRSLPANIISLIISSMVKSFVSYPIMLEMLVSEVKTSQIAFFFRKYYKTIVMKLVLFHLLLYVIVLFSLYYLSFFSTIYKSSQISWFTGCIYSILTSLLVNFAIAVGLTVFRVIGIKCKCQYAYNIHLYVRKNVINKVNCFLICIKKINNCF